MTSELYWSSSAFASEYLQNADYDPKGGRCSSRAKPICPPPQAVCTHSSTIRRGDFFDKRGRRLDLSQSSLRVSILEGLGEL
jgi:hypothetical protein